MACERRAIMKTKDFLESLISAKDLVNQYPGVFYADNDCYFVQRAML